MEMEAVMDVKYRPAVPFPKGGAAVAPAKKMMPPTAGEGVESVYRECLKNHAASLGAHALDGCGEFMPSPAADPSNPASLKCAACGCHRNFHRRLPEAPPSPPLLALPPPPPSSYLLHAVPRQRGEETPEDRLPVAGDADEDTEVSDEGSDYDDDDRPASPLPAPAVMPPGYLSSATQMLLSLSSCTSAPGSAPAVMASRPPAPGPGAPASRKRFRTRFSPEQKQQMQALSERLGWRLQKSEVALVDERCREIGVGKGVFKVWMHNNKHNFLGGHSARRTASVGASTYHPPSPTPPPLPATATAFAPAVHADFNVINGSSAPAAADNSRAQPATTSGGSGSLQSSGAPASVN